MKILFISLNPPAYNPAQPLGRVVGLLQELSARHELTLACYNFSDDTSSALSKLPIKLVTAPKFQPGWFERLRGGSHPAANLKTALLGLDQQFDIIQSDGAESAWLVGELAREWRRPGLVWLRPGETEETLVAGIEILAASRPEKSRWLPDGLDTSYFTRQTPVNVTSQEIIFRHVEDDPASEEALNFVQTEVWAEVRRLTPVARLLIVTPGIASFEEIEEGAEGISRIRGVQDLRPLYQGCRLALLPYLRPPTDYQPMQEAWAMQVPLITMPPGATTLPDLQLGDHYVQGADGPSLAALATRLLEIRGPGLHLAQQGRQLVENRFSWAACATRLEQIWGSEETQD